MRVMLLAATLWAGATAAYAHVTVSPAESKPAQRETYSFNVPTEGASATTGVELEAPPEVVIVSVEDPAAELVRAGDRVVTVKWRVDIPPGEARRLNLVAQNPARGQEITWKVHQLFADGSRRDWADAPGTRQPAPRTRLLAH